MTLYAQSLRARHCTAQCENFDAILAVAYRSQALQRQAWQPKADNSLLDLPYMTDFNSGSSTLLLHDVMQLGKYLLLLPFSVHKTSSGRLFKADGTLIAGEIISKILNLALLPGKLPFFFRAHCEASLKLYSKQSVCHLL